MTVRNVVRWLGGPRVLRRRVTSDLELAQLVAKGLPTEAIDQVVKREILSRVEVDRLILPRRTLLHRRRHHTALSVDESDRLARATRVAAVAAETFQDEAKGSIWLRRSNRALGGVAPLELIGTSDGARLVEETLGRIAHGLVS